MNSSPTLPWLMALSTALAYTEAADWLASTTCGGPHSSDSIHRALERLAYTCSTCSAAWRTTAHFSYVVSCCSLSSSMMNSLSTSSLRPASTMWLMVPW